MKLKRNMGRLDQVMRAGIGLLLIDVGFINTSLVADRTTAVIVGILGLMNLIVAISGFCPLYVFAGVSTRSAKDS